MALQCFVDTFNIGTGAAASTVVRTGYGFQPKACLYWWSGRTETVTTFAAKNPQPGFGVAVSPTSRACVTSYSQNGAGTMITNRWHDNANVMATSTFTTVDALEGSADLQSFDAGGQTLVITDAFPASYRVHCLALGGSDLTNAAVAQFQTPDSTGVQSITSLSFQPDALVFITAGHTAAPPVITPTAAFSIGMATGTAAQGVLGFVDTDAGGSSSTGTYQYSGECLAFLSSSALVTARAAFSAFLANGFQLNWLEIPGVGVNQYCWALALKGGSYLVGAQDTGAFPGNTTPESGFGFAPTGCLLLGSGYAQSTQDTIGSRAVKWQLGGFTSLTNRACQSIVSQLGANSATCASSLNEDACLRHLTNATTSSGVTDVGAIGSDGFTLTMDVADATGTYVTYLAFGNGTAPPATKAPPPRRQPLRFMRRAA